MDNISPSKAIDISPSKETIKKKENRGFEIDYVGTGTFQVSQHNLLHKRSLQPFKTNDAILSARGLHHRSREVFAKEVRSTSSLISSLMRREKVTSAKYKPSPQLLTPHFLRALAFERLKQLDKAIEDYSVCIQIDSNCAAAYFNRSGLLKVKGDYAAALEDMNAAVSLEPANIEYRTQRSMLYRLTGTYLEAVKETIFSRALRKQPGFAQNIQAGGDINLGNDLLYASKLLDDPIVALLLQSPEERPIDQLDPIIDFLKGLKVFADFSSRDGLIRVAKNISMVVVQRNKFIFREGEPGHHFYIVLDGEVSIVKNKKVHADSVTGAGLLDEGGNEKGTVVWKCYRGHCFGETALESAGGLRTAGALATQNTRLMVLHADEFQAILHSFKSALKEEVRSVLTASVLFDDWSAEDIEYLASQAIVRNFGSNIEIQKAGEKVNCLSMIKSGLVKLIKAMPKPDTVSIRTAAAAASRHSGSNSNSNNGGSSRCGSMASMSSKLSQDYSEETPGLWVLEKNWRHRLESPTDAFTKVNHNNNFSTSTGSIGVNNTSGGGGQLKEGYVEFTVGVLGSGEVFGELAVLDTDKLSPVSALSSTAVELYCFDINTMAHVRCHTHAKTMNILTESLTMHDPPIEKVAYYFRTKYNWELRKNGLMKRLKM